jgi:hypothetical protein
MRPLPLAAGVTVGVEMAVQKRLQDVHEGVVDHPIAVGGRGDEAALGAIDPVGGERTRTVAPLLQFALETQQVPFLVEVEARHHRPAPLAAPRLAGRQEQVVPAHQALPETAVALHGCEQAPAGNATQARSASEGESFPRLRVPHKPEAPARGHKPEAPARGHKPEAPARGNRSLAGASGLCCLVPKFKGRAGRSACAYQTRPAGVSVRPGAAWPADAGTGPGLPAPRPARPWTRRFWDCRSGRRGSAGTGPGGHPHCCCGWPPRSCCSWRNGTSSDC